MDFQTAVIVSTIILGATVAVVVAVLANRQRTARDEELRRQASTRGWTFETATEGAFRGHRWRGTTDGVAWMAESLESTGKQGGQRSSNRRRISRWQTTASRGPASPIVCMGVPEGAEKPSFEVAQGEGWLAALAQKAARFAFDKGLDAYFGVEIGKQIDAAALRRVEGAAVPGFIVMAADTDAASRLLFQGLAKALGDAVHDRESALSDERRPWVLFWQHGVALAQTERLTTPEEIERLIRAGVALSRVRGPEFGAPG